MKRFIYITLISFVLTGCFSSSDSKKSIKISEDSYVVQTVTADYGSSEVVYGNIVGDRTIQNTVLKTEKSDFSISTYKNILYHIGRFQSDNISRFDSNLDLENPEWSYSANDDGDASANPYKVVHVNDDKAYVIRYDSSNVWEINPNATNSDSFVTARIDLSAYNYGQAASPNMSDAVYYNGYLYVIMQRLDYDEDFTMLFDKTYVAVIDTETNKETNTYLGKDGLFGIPLNADNANDSALHNGYLYVAGRGDYSNNSGALDKINLVTYEIESIANVETFEILNDNDNNRYAHITDVAIIDNNKGYILVSVEGIYPELPSSYIFPFNPSDNKIGNKLDIPSLKNTLVSDITTDANGKLWIAVSNPENPEILVYDTDIDKQSGDSIKLNMPPSKIEFLTVE